jgi:hypothetical protein
VRATYGVHIHLSGPKALLWPRFTVKFDGKILNVPTLHRFMEPEQTNRHAKEILAG